MDTVNLDDITKTSFCIPFKKPPTPNKHTRPNDTYGPQPPPLPSTPHASRDLPFPAGNDLRFEAYRVAWGRCLARMQEIITYLQTPTVEDVVDAVMDSHSISNPRTRTLKGLPYSELPVITIINPTLGPSLLHKIISSLETTPDNAMDTDTDDTPPPTSVSQPSPPCLVVHFRAVDFPNITTAMKAVVSGFVDKAKEKGLDRAERKATTASTSLAGYDIGYLEAWYRSLKGKCKESPSRLVVILHDFEQFDLCIMQDVFYICSRAFSTPLTFILSLSSPLPNFLNAVYPATTLSLLRVKTIKAPGGNSVLGIVLRKTFFDPDFETDIVIGPGVLEFLQDLFTRHYSSIDVILTVLQLAHLKHFTSDPLTALVHATPSAQVLNQSKATSFVESLWTRLGLDSPVKVARKVESRSTAIIIKAIDRAREEFQLRARNIRVGFGIMRTLQSELRRCGYKGLGWSSDGACDVCVDVILDLLRGRLGRDARQLGTMLKKLKVGELEKVLDRLNTYFFELPAHLRAKTEEQEARSQLILLRGRVSQEGESGVDVAEELSEWLKEYLSDKLRPLEELELWDVWYTRNTPPPSELLNPSVRACIVAGLLRPYEFSVGAGLGKGKSKNRALWELPDTSILFKRYLDSGRMVNVFDWFESFKGVLEMQRKCGLLEAGIGEDEERKRGTPRSPRKKGGKLKGKGKEKEVMMIKEDENEEWKLEVQARFIRALHELDYLGFVKHTGRKRDHLLRTVFEVGDDDDEEGDDD